VGETAEAEFARLSARIANKQATDAERSRWRELRASLVPPAPAAPVREGFKPREHPRATKKLRFSYTAEMAMPVSFTDEISAGGLRMTVHQHVEVGAKFVFRLQLAGLQDPEPLTVIGRAAWVKRDGNHFSVGIEFVNIRPDEKERIEAWSHSDKKTP
jgi:hypothetical protein